MAKLKKKWRGAGKLQKKGEREENDEQKSKRKTKRKQKRKFRKWIGSKKKGKVTGEGAW